MPRHSEGARLYLRQRKGRRSVYVILDEGGVEQSTGCGPEAVGRAETALARYLATKHKSTVGTHDPTVLTVADVVAFYGEIKAPSAGAPKNVWAAHDNRIFHSKPIIAFFGGDPITTIRGATCRDYVRWRTHVGDVPGGRPERQPRAVSDQTARRELVVLSAAINAYHREYGLETVPLVTMPDLAKTKRLAIDHAAAASLLAGALGFYRDAGGAVRRRPKSTRTQRKRTARFILIGLYSGTRHSAIVAARWVPCVDGPWIDVERGILYRLGDAEEETNKRRPPARIPPRLLAHLRRWRRMDMEGAGEPCTYVIARSGQGLAGKLRKGWSGARLDAGLPPTITPHVLRHTAGTWLAQGGAKTREAADYLGMTEKTFETTYYHGHPDYQSGIGGAFSASQREAVRIKAERSLGRPNNDPICLERTETK